MDILRPESPDDNHVGEKRCKNPDCQRWFPATPQYFHRDSHAKDDLYTQCKECKNKKAEAHRSRSDVKKRTSVYNKVYHEVYYSKPENREHKRAQDNAHYHLPDVHERERARAKVYNETYLKRPEAQLRRLVNKRTRDARKKAIQGTYNAKQIADLLQRQKHRCYYCSAKFEQKSGKYIYHVDHTFPLSRVEGTDIPANDISYLVLACPSCNQSKSDKFPWEWPEGGRLL